MEAGVRIVWSVARITLLPVSRHHDLVQANPAPGISRNGHLGPREGRGAVLHSDWKSVRLVLLTLLSMNPKYKES